MTVLAENVEKISNLKYGCALLFAIWKQQKKNSVSTILEVKVQFESYRQQTTVCVTFLHSKQ